CVYSVRETVRVKGRDGLRMASLSASTACASMVADEVEVAAGTAAWAETSAPTASTMGPQASTTAARRRTREGRVFMAGLVRWGMSWRAAAARGGDPARGGCQRVGYSIC